MPQAQTQYQQILEEANAALDGREWAQLRHYAQAMRREAPHDETAWSYLGIANFKLGEATSDRAQMEEGLQQMANATRLNSNSAMAWSNYGLALLNEKRFDEALDAIIRATELDPLDIQPFHHRFIIELALERFADAAATYSDIIKRKNVSEYSLIIPIHVVPHIDGVRRLSRPLTVDIAFDGQEYRVEENDFDAFGCGETLPEAIVDYGNEFETLIEEYVETDDPLDKEATAMAERLRALL